MKLGIITDEISQDLAHALDVAREIGCRGVELRSMWEGGVAELSPRRVKEVAALLEQRSLECYNIAGPVFKCTLGSQREVREHVDILKRCCEVAHGLGAPTVRADAPHVRAFTFWREPGVALEAVWGRIVEQIARAADVAADAELTLAVENEYSVYVGGGALLARLLGEVEAARGTGSNVRAIWDPQNALFDPDAEAPYPDGYEAIADRIAFCHIKDGTMTPEGPKMLPVGDGDAMLAELVARLKRDGYASYLSLETHWRPEEDMDVATVRLPGGATFSGPSAEAGSRLCMANLQRLVGEA
jgi:sugar phosphate isomerase/epimerase